MLQTIRDKVTGWIAIVFLGAIAIVFVFWGIDFQSANATYAAKVEGERISVQEARNAWQQRQSQLQQMLRTELPPELVQSEQAQLLDRLVREELLTQRAERLGYRVPDEVLAQRVMEIPQFQVDGKFDKDRYAAALRSANLTQTQFEQDMATGLQIEQLQNGIIDSAFVTPAELSRRFALERQERELAYALIPSSSFAAQVEVTAEQIQKWYEEHQSDYMLPETVDLQYVELARAASQSRVQVSDEALREYYEQVKEKFETPERRRARHVLITTEEGRDEAAALKLAEEVAAKAKGGADFAELAKTYSKDPGSAAEGGDLGWAQRGMFVGPFEEALFSMTPNEIRGPVKTQFGYHVIKLEEIEAGHLRSFDEVRAELEAEYRQEQAESLFAEDAEKLADASFSALTELESVAKTLNLPLKTVTGFTREGGGELGSEPAVIEAVFSPEVLEQRRNSSLIPLGEDRAVVVRVTNHKPAEPRPLAEVRDQIEAQLRQQAAREAAEARGAEILERLRKGESWEQVAQALKIAPIEPRFVGRQDSVAPRAVVRAAFEVPATKIAPNAPQFGGVATDDGNYAVYALTQVRNGDPATETPDAKKARSTNAARQMGNEEFAAYLAEAVRTADIDKNPRVFE